MSNELEREAPQPQKRPLLSVSRIVLLIILLLAVVALVLDRRARSDHERSLKSLNEAMSAQEVKGNYCEKEDVPQHMQGSCVREVDDDGNETYRWAALFGLRTYCLKVEYEGVLVTRVDPNPES